MKERDLPKPNTQALSWFYGEEKKGTLLLNPKYQRNPIWSMGQKCFLIDSLISGAPIPQIFINIKTNRTGNQRDTVHEIVDGQQRLRAILEFMNDEYSLIKTTAKSYPVSSLYEPHIGKKYSELPDHLQEKIWNYQVAIQELRGWNEPEIRSLFRRLNYVVEKLNNQELRHSQYFGSFVEAVEELAEEEFWDEITLFSRKESQRMKDVEFISELFIALIDGIQNGQEELDTFYAKYDASFPQRGQYVAKFRQTMDSLKTIKSLLKNSRFTKKADFYALFFAVSYLNKESLKAVNLSDKESSLRHFAELLSQPQDKTDTVEHRYNKTVIEGPNKRAKREERVKILLEILE